MFSFIKVDYLKLHLYIITGVIKTFLMNKTGFLFEKLIVKITAKIKNILSKIGYIQLIHYYFIFRLPY